jgi:hypothetical protein
LYASRTLKTLAYEREQGQKANASGNSYKTLTLAKALNC